MHNFFSGDQKIQVYLSMFNCLLRKLEVTTDKSMLTLLSSYLFRCASGEQTDLLIKWLSVGSVCSETSIELAKIVPLNKAMRYQILKVLYKSGKQTPEERSKLLNLEMKDNFSDYDAVQKNAVEASDSSIATKERLWMAYVNNEKHFSSMPHFKASVQNFYNLEDETQCGHFGDKFFQSVESIFATKHRDYAESFFVNLSPAFLAHPSYKAKFEALLEKAKLTENTHFINLLEEEIERLEESLIIRGLK